MAERDAAMLMVYSRWKKHRPISSLGADRGYDTRDFVRVMREIECSPARDAECESPRRQCD
jgi:hypothetical protein